ncbi:MAG: alpha/beta hydrolase [Porticoccus sp.]|nr:alpha/beta hydrolase [Porticoccus sp.]
MHAQNSLYILMKRLSMILFIALFLFASPALLADEHLLEVKTLRVNNYDMAYVERGEGVPLILVHGLVSDYRTWLPLMEEFSETNRTIAVSLRHYHPEQWDGKGNDLTLEQHADDLAAFIRTLNIGPVYLLGHSRGGAVALLTASKHPEQVRRLILADPSPLTSMLQKQPEVQTVADKRKDKLQAVMKHYQQGDTEAGLKGFVSYVAGSKAWEGTSKKRRDSLRDNIWTPISVLNDIETTFTCTDAGNLPVPVLMITGERSAPLYGYMNSALLTCLTQSSDAIISDAGHMMFHANPTAFIFEVQDFIAPQ